MGHHVELQGAHGAQDQGLGPPALEEGLGGGHLGLPQGGAEGEEQIRGGPKRALEGVERGAPGDRDRRRI